VFLQQLRSRQQGRSSSAATSGSKQLGVKRVEDRRKQISKQREEIAKLLQSVKSGTADLQSKLGKAGAKSSADAE